MVFFLFRFFEINAQPNAKKFVLVIDAGHGGHDPGCHGNKHKEKDVALAVALKLGKYLEENCPDVKVVFTRKTDVFLELNEELYNISHFEPIIKKQGVDYGIHMDELEKHKKRDVIPVDVDVLMLQSKRITECQDVLATIYMNLGRHYPILAGEIENLADKHGGELKRRIDMHKD